MSSYYKEDGTEWYNYFFIRRNVPEGFYFAWIGSKREVFPDVYFRCSTNARTWIMTQDWKKIVDEEFEKEVLGGLQKS